MCRNLIIRNCFLILYGLFVVQLFFPHSAFSSPDNTQPGKSSASWENVLFMRNIFDSIQALYNRRDLPKKSGLAHSSSDSTKRATRVIGKCYLGPGTDHPLDSGSVHFSIRQAQQINENEPTYWNEPNLTGGLIKKAGDFTCSFNIAQNVQQHILVISHGYGIQWWDGASVFEQPTPVSFTTDTVYHDFHFEPRCSLYCKISKPVDISGAGLVDPTGLYILPPSTPLGIYTLIDHISLNDIPVGNYYLKQYGDDYLNMFYPNASSKSSAPIVAFSISGTIKDTLIWTMIEKIYNPPDPITGTLLIKVADSIEFLEIVKINIDRGRSTYDGRSVVDTISFNFTVGERNFLGRYLDHAIFWYPGTFFRAQAETLSLNPNENRTIVLPATIRRRMYGQFPKFKDKKLSFEPILSLQGQQKSLGASFLVDSLGAFNVAAPADTYSLWNVPRTEGYKRTEGWGAFKVDSIIMTSSGMVYGKNLLYLTAPWNTHSIEGTVTCRKNPLIACFDTFGRPVSATKIYIKENIREKTYPRGRFFLFDLIDEKPYTVSYSLNFLAPGKYAIVKVEPPDSDIGLTSIRWYGGTEYKTTFIAFDDISLLKIPNNATWVTVDSNTTVVTLGSWTNTLPRSDIHQLAQQNDLQFRALPGGKIAIQFQNSKSAALVRILSMDGKILGNFKMESGAALTLGRNYLNKPLIFEIDNGRKILKKTIMCR